MPDLILHNANVITMDQELKKSELVAIRNGRILAVEKDDSLKWIRHRNTKVIDCRGKTILPGFVDPHCHPFAFAKSLVTLDLSPKAGVRSISDIQVKIRQLSQDLPPGTWIRCAGYNEFYLKEKRHPIRLDLDLATSDHPIRLAHRTGHADVLNSLALKLTGISKETSEPEGGLIDRDIVTGDPNGLLFGMGELLSKLVPPLDSDQLELGIRLASLELLSLGITSIQDASYYNDIERFDMLKRWKTGGHIKPRVCMMLGAKGFEDFRKNESLFQERENQLRVSGVKIILDETTGRLNPGQAELNDLVSNIHQSGLQAVIHAVEETSIEAVCTAIEYALEKSPRLDHRHRIEHCSVCPEALSKRLASLGVMVVTQPSFIYYNGERYLETVPDTQLKNLYPMGTLMKNGVQVASSSDCPVVPANPLIGIYSAVSRKSETGKAVLAKEGITPLDALRTYTHNAARATFDEKIKGSITPGKVADLAVLSGDPITSPTEEIKDIRVEMTILNGEVVWEDKKTANQKFTNSYSNL